MSSGVMTNKKILIINASPRVLLSNKPERQKKFITIPRNGYKLEVPTYSSCLMIQNHLVDYFLSGNSLRDKFEITNSDLFNIEGCIACYNCVENGKCYKRDVMQNIYPELETCNHIIIISPLYYGTIPSQLLAFFNRLYPYWIKSKDIDPVTGFPNEYPKPVVTTIGTCADPWQRWKLFDDTLFSIYKEIGWKMNKGIYHFPNYLDTPNEIEAIINIGSSIKDYQDGNS